MKFLHKAVTIYSGKKVGFDYKNNYGCNKLAYFWIDIINKINYKTSHVIYLFKIGVEKCPTCLERLQVISPIALTI